MIGWLFFFYFLIFFLVFSVHDFKKAKGEKNGKISLKVFLLPIILGLIIIFLSVIKLYFIYKILVLFLAFLTFLLSYWHWGKSIGKWWRG